jgi:hypothetical protein
MTNAAAYTTSNDRAALREKVEKAWRKTFKKLQSPLLYFAIIVGALIISAAVKLEIEISYQNQQIITFLENADTGLQDSVTTVDEFLRELPVLARNLTQIIVDAGSTGIVESVQLTNKLLDIGYLDTVTSIITGFNQVFNLLPIPINIPVPPRVRITTPSWNTQLPFVNLTTPLFGKIPFSLKSEGGTIVQAVVDVGYGYTAVLKAIGSILICWAILSPISTFIYYMVKPTSKAPKSRVIRSLMGFRILGRPGIGVPLVIGILLCFGSLSLKQVSLKTKSDCQQPLMTADEQIRIFLKTYNVAVTGAVTIVNEKLEEARGIVNVRVNQAFQEALGAINNGLEASRSSLQTGMNQIAPVNFGPVNIGPLNLVLFPQKIGDIASNFLVIDPNSISLYDAFFPPLEKIFDASVSLSYYIMVVGLILISVPAFILIITLLEPWVSGAVGGIIIRILKWDNPKKQSDTELPDVVRANK